MWIGIFNRQKSAAQIGIDGFVPFVVAEVFNRRPNAINSGVGENNIELAESFDGFFNRALHVAGFGNIGLNGDGFAANFLDLRDGLRDFVARIGERDDFGALLREKQRRGFADARTCAGNERDFVGELHNSARGNGIRVPRPESAETVKFVAMTIGILGGGQLGRMLALAGYPLGLQFKILDPSSDATAGQIAPLLCEDINDVPSLLWFSKNLDAVTYEWENVPAQSARYLNERVPVFPPVKALEISSDRLKEKSFFRENGVPTPAFESVNSRDELEGAAREIGFPCVLKTRKFGYDGKGQFVLKSKNDLNRAWEKLGGVPLILEGFVAFEREVSILGVRAQNGEMRFYPLVENHHREGILRLSIAPVQNPDLQSDAEKFAGKLMEKLDYVGVMALELFQISEKLIANEIAPRVHNSGHWTIEGSQCSQFENHVRAVAGLPLGNTEMKVEFAAMVNLIGNLPPLCEILKIEGAHAHFYGKSEKIGRKVGHITLTAQTRAELDARVLQAQKLTGN